MNSYGRVLDLMPDLNAQGVTGADVTRAARALAEASRAARTMMGGRQIHSTLETRYFNGDSKGHLWVGDLISVTTFKRDDDGDGTYETIYAVTDFWLWPDNRESGMAARRLDFNPLGDWPSLPNGRRKVQIVGKFGYSEILEPVVGAAAITGSVADASSLTIMASATVAGLLGIGDQFFLGTEELGPIVSEPTTSILVQARGINGTTAAAHSPAVAIYLRRYPDDIERAVRADAARYLWRSSQGYPEGGFREMWPAISQTMRDNADPASVAG